MLHGGSYFSSGNDLGAFADAAKDGDMDNMMKIANEGVNVTMVNMLLAFSRSVKPIVAVIRGGAMGIGFTLLAHTTFLYCSPETYFMTPFM